MACVTRKSCQEIARIFARVVCVLVLLAQGGLIDYYLVAYADSEVNYTWLAWIVADVIVCTIFIIAFVVSYQKISFGKNRELRNRYPCLKALQGNNTTGELPLGYIAWGIYSVLLVARLAIFFKRGAAKLNEENFFGLNMMKTAIGLSAFVFLFLVLSSSGAKHQSVRAAYIGKLIGSTTLDILDSVEFLEILFIQESRLFLTFNLWNCILAFSCINFMLPTFPLLVLSHTRFGRNPGKRVVKLIHCLLFILLIDIPFLGIRLYLWHNLDRDISVFIIKNAIMILIGSMEIFELSEMSIDEADGKKRSVEEEDDSEIEMEEVNHASTT